MKIHIGNPANNKGDRKLSIDITEDDVWDMDNQLSMIILPMLLLLKESISGMPPNFMYVGGEEYVDQTSFDFYSETSDWAWQENSKNWHKVLDKMIWSFQQLAYTDYYALYHRQEEDDVATVKRRITIEKWYDLAGCNEHERRIQEGLDLFARYYRYLWF